MTKLKREAIMSIALATFICLLASATSAPASIDSTATVLAGSPGSLLNDRSHVDAGAVRAGSEVGKATQRAVAAAMTDTTSQSPVRPDAEPAPTAITLEVAISLAAHEFGVDPARLLRVARCESSLRGVPRVGRAQEIGWFQWLPSTWEWLAPKSGLGYTVLDITDVTAQARLTAWAFSAGYADPPFSYWSCDR